jgi:hypothetical protein
MLDAECGLQSFGLDLLQESVGIGKEQLVPCISRPSELMPRLVLLAREPVLMKRQMPVHVDDQHIERDVVLAKSAHQIFEFLIAVSPVTRPPRAECESRRQRNASGDSREVSKRLFVIVSVAEKVPVLSISERALHHPGPWALLTLRKAKVVGVEEWTRRIVHQHPPIARDQPGTHGFARLAAERPVEGSRRSHEIACLLHSWMPGHWFAIQREIDAQIVVGEFAVSSLGVSQRKLVSLQLQCLMTFILAY